MNEYGPKELAKDPRETLQSLTMWRLLYSAAKAVADNTRMDSVSAEVAASLLLPGGLRGVFRAALFQAGAWLVHEGMTASGIIGALAGVPEVVAEPIRTGVLDTEANDTDTPHVADVVEWLPVIVDRLGVADKIMGQAGVSEELFGLALDELFGTQWRGQSLLEIVKSPEWARTVGVQLRDY